MSFLMQTSIGILPRTLFPWHTRASLHQR